MGHVCIDPNCVNKINQPDTNTTHQLVLTPLAKGIQLNKSFWIIYCLWTEQHHLLGICNIQRRVQKKSRVEGVQARCNRSAMGCFNGIATRQGNQVSDGHIFFGEDVHELRKVLKWVGYVSLNS